MSKTTRYGILIGLVIVLVGLFVWYKVTPGPYDNLATCLSDKGVKFYGAFWCPHCQQQKRFFAKSAKLLPYIECSTPDGQGTLSVCKELAIESYPTWIFPDGTVEKGERTTEFLAEKASCPLN